MELRDSTKKFLDALATLCEIYGVTKISPDENDGVRFVIDNGVIAAEYCKTFDGEGVFYGVRETGYAVEYRPENGVKDNDD